MKRARLLAFTCRAQMVLEELFPATIRIGESPVEYQVSRGPFMRGDQKLADVGLLTEFNVTFRLRKDLVAQMPDAGVRVFWVEGQRKLRIIRSRDGGEADSSWAIACETANK